MWADPRNKKVHSSQLLAITDGKIGAIMAGEGLTSFVIIAYNEAENIGRTMASITALDDLGMYEIVVINDGSRDNTAEVVTGFASHNPHIRLIDLMQNCGRGCARRKGIAAARGELIATVDADIVLPADWLHHTRLALRDHDAVGGTPVPDGDVQYLYKRFGLIPRVVPSTTQVPGSNGLYRCKVFDIITFDSDLREGEDSAFNYAMAQQGLSAATVPGLLVLHEENKSFGASLKWLFDVGRGATRQLLIYRKIRQPDVVAGAFFLATAFGIVVATYDHRLIGITIPMTLVLIASIQHVRTRFDATNTDWWRIGAAAVTNSVLLSAYFIGRIVGLTVLSAGRRALVSSRGRKV